jgi:hypothetical protein
VLSTNSIAQALALVLAKTLAVVIVFRYAHRGPHHKVNRLYERVAEHLIATVRRQVHSPRDLAEDACSFAWLTLLRRPDVDPTSRACSPGL